MPDESITTNTIKTASDGSVKIAVEKYNEMLETIANQKGSIASITERLNRALNQPPVINRTTVIKTAEMAAKEHKTWGITFMGFGAVTFAVGALHFRAGSAQS